MTDNDPLWQEFFVLAQNLASRPMPLPDKGMAITQFGLHYRMRSLYRQLTLTRGTKVQTGPFKGMDIGPHGEHMSACLARWLGLYESPLHPAINNATSVKYDTLINIGAGEGYYAIGMARLMPQLQVIAADTNPDMQAACTANAALNDVAGRIAVRGEISTADFAALVKGKTLIICDIEGAEEELLNPAATPALLDCDFIIELHDVYRPGLSARMADMYSATHNISIIRAGQPPAVDMPFVADMPELELFLLTYEGRAGSTPWGVFTRK